MSKRKRSRKPASGPQRPVTFYRRRKQQEAPQPPPEATPAPSTLEPRDMTPSQLDQAIRTSLTLLEERIAEKPENRQTYQTLAHMVAKLELMGDRAGEWDWRALPVEERHSYPFAPDPAQDRRLYLRGIEKLKARGAPADWRKIARLLEWIWLQRVEVCLKRYGEAATQAYLKELELPGSVALVRCICHCLEHLPAVKPPTARKWLATAQTVTALHAFRHGEGSHRALLASLPEVHRALLEDAA